MQRVAVTAHLQEGAETEARKLIDAGPPFDPGEAGFDHHSVFLGHGLVVFLFEGHDIERQLTDLVNDPVRAAGFGAWGPLLVESPQVAQETYYWSREEQT